MRYTVESLLAMKATHEQWVADRLGKDPAATPDYGVMLVTQAVTGDDLWPLLRASLAWQFDLPRGLTSEEEDLIDETLQEVADWCDISSDVEDRGLPAVRETKRRLTELLAGLSQVDLALLVGMRVALYGATSLPTALLKVVRSSELESQVRAAQ